MASCFIRGAMFPQGVVFTQPSFWCGPRKRTKTWPRVPREAFFCQSIRSGIYPFALHPQGVGRGCMGLSPQQHTHSLSKGNDQLFKLFAVRLQLLKWVKSFVLCGRIISSTFVLLSMQSQANARKMNDEKNCIYRLELVRPKRTYRTSYPQKM